MLARWLGILGRFEFTVQHRPSRNRGREIEQNQDQLTIKYRGHNEEGPTGNVYTTTSSVAPAITSITNATTMPNMWTRKQWKRKQEEDHVLGPLRRRLMENRRPVEQGLRGETDDVSHIYLGMWDSLRMSKDGVLEVCRPATLPMDPPIFVPLVPSQWWLSTMRRAHEAWGAVPV